MRRNAFGALLAAAGLVLTAGCAAGTAGAGAGEAGAADGRDAVVVPPFSVAGVAEREGQRVAGELRDLIRGMTEWTAVSGNAIEGARRQFAVETLDEVTGRQFALQLGGEMVALGSVQQGGAGLQADVRFIDTRTGDQFLVEDATGANAGTLAQAIFGEFQQKIQSLAMLETCRNQLEAGDYETALATCDQVASIVPTSVAALTARGRALVGLERWQEANETFQRALEIDPDAPEGILGSALALSGLGQRDEALVRVNRYLELNPGNRVLAAQRLAQAGDFVTAYSVLEPAMAENLEDPAFQRFLFALGTAAGQTVQQEQDEAAARPYLETALRAYEALSAADTVELSLEDRRKAIAIQTGLGNTAEALEMARQATQQYDTVAAIWSQYALALSAAERYQEEAEALSRVIELDPDFQDVYLRRAMARLASGDQSAAMRDLEMSAGRGNQENVARILFREGGTAMRDEEFDTAATLLQQAYDYASPELKQDISFFLGYSLVKQGEAIAQANTENELEPARRALEIFQRAVPVLQGSQHENAAAVRQYAEQYITNQEAIIDARGG